MGWYDNNNAASSRLWYGVLQYHRLRSAEGLQPRVGKCILIHSTHKPGFRLGLSLSVPSSKNKNKNTIFSECNQLKQYRDSSPWW